MQIDITAVLRLNITSLLIQKNLKRKINISRITLKIIIKNKQLDIIECKIANKLVTIKGLKPKKQNFV